VRRARLLMRISGWPWLPERWRQSCSALAYRLIWAEMGRNLSRLADTIGLVLVPALDGFAKAVNILIDQFQVGGWGEMLEEERLQRP
jgi:hypothetical protein